MWLLLTLRKSPPSFLGAPLLQNGAVVTATTAPSSLPCCCCQQRWIHVARTGLAKKSKWSDRFLDPADKYKRPSDLEIQKKDLPPNQPTLSERVGKWQKN
jgi:hypothetical protein